MVKEKKNQFNKLIFQLSFRKIKQIIFIKIIYYIKSLNTVQRILSNTIHIFLENAHEKIS